MYNNIVMNSIFDFSSITANIIGGITVFLITVTIPAILIWLWRRFVVIKKLHEQELINVLSSIGANRLSIIKSKFFIKTMGQFNVPIEGCVENSNRFPLVNYFINQIFLKNDLSKKRFVVLGGSGMGKSTFITSLIFSYFQKYRYKKIPYNIYLVNLGNEDATLRIKELSKNIDANKSILILEAMDERTEAQNNNQEYLNFINKTSIGFKYVIITCRTNIFVDEQSFPKYTGFYDGTNLLKFNIIHISQFSEQEIQLYLDNKYGIGTKKYQKAMTIKNNCNGLLSRAMILNFIDDLLDIASEKSITSFKIYNTIIEKWLCRELRIDNIADSLNEVKKLYKFSKDIAMYMYRTDKQYIPKKEYELFYEKNGYKLDPYSYNSRSLITRRNDGAVMFSHKSFFDYYIAIITFEKPEIQFNQNLYDSKEFAKDIYRYYLNDEMFLLINYYHLPSENEDFSSIKINSILEVALSLIENKDVEIINKDIFCVMRQFWKELIKRMCYQYGILNSMMHIDSSKSDVYNGLQLTRILNAQTITKSLISKVQDCFISLNEISLLKTKLKDIQSELYELKVAIPTIEHHFNFVTRNERIIYPWSLTVNCLQNVNPDIVLGRSFSSEEQIISSIVSIIKNKSGFVRIFVLSETKDIMSVVKNIIQLSDILRDIKEFDANVVIYNISEFSFCYVVNSNTINYTEAEVYSCLNNILES